MPRIVAVGDVHLRDKKLADIAEAWKRTVGWAVDNGADLIVQAGDVFDKPNVAGREADVGTIYSAFLDPFKELQSPPRLVMIPGNHDIGGPREKDALAAFDKHSWIQVLHDPVTLEVLPGISVCAVPWINRTQLVAKLVDKGMAPKDANERSKSGLRALLSKMAETVGKHKEKGNFVLLLAHMEVTGAKYSSGQVQADGVFEFSPKTILEVGADAYALGHIHRRQSLPSSPNQNDGYLGTLCQLNFGEEGNETGFRCIDVEDGKIAYDKFINNRASPRYFTTTDLSKTEYAHGKDYVKLKGETKPDVLPEGVTFSKVAERQATERRFADDISADSPIEKLLKLWAEHAKCELDVAALADACRRLESTVKMPVEPVGSLERIDRICLQNIASHENTEVDLSELAGLCGIDGPNGGGKTTLLEALLVALYGHCPSRPSLPTLVRQRDDVREAMVEVDFQSSGTKYRARREFRRTGKTFTHKAHLIDLRTNDAVAGPKVEDVGNRISTIVGDLKLVLSGVFSAQEEMDNLVNLEPAPRKDLLAKLLGTEKFLVLGKAAEKETKSDVAWIEVKRSVAEGIKAKVASEKDDKRAAEELGKKLENQRLSATVLATKIEDVSGQLAKADANAKERKRLESKVSELKAELAELAASTGNLGKSLAELSSLDEAALQEEEGRLKKLETKLAQLEGSRTASLANAERFSKEAEAAMAMAREKETQRKLEHSQLREKAMREAEGIRASRESNLAQLEAKFVAIREEQATTKAQIESASRQAKSLEGFPDTQACKTCPLASSGLEARNSIPDLERKSARLQEREAKGKEVISNYVSQTKDLVAKASEVPGLDKWQPEKTKEIEGIVAKAKGLSEKASRSKPSEELLKEIDDVRGMAERLPEVEEKLRKARVATLERAKVEEKVRANRAREQKVNEELARTVLPDAVDRAEIEKRMASAKEELDRSRREEAGLRQMLGRQEAVLDEHKRNREELAKVAKEIAEREAKCAANRALAKAFGRDGIPQLIVDSTIPHFQDIMTELLSAFDGRWSIRIQSQKEKGKGEYAEVVDILVHDGFSERDVRTYSGGEKQVLKTIIRIAFATLQAERSGKGLKILVLDEATDKMETSLSEPFMKMLGKISKAFNQVFIVSHVDHVLISLPSRISLSLDGGSTKAIVTA